MLRDGPHKPRGWWEWEGRTQKQKDHVPITHLLVAEPLQAAVPTQNTEDRLPPGWVAPKLGQGSSVLTDSGQLLQEEGPVGVRGLWADVPVARPPRQLPLYPGMMLRPRDAPDWTGTVPGGKGLCVHSSWSPPPWVAQLGGGTFQRGKKSQPGLERGTKH